MQDRNWGVAAAMISERRGDATEGLERGGRTSDRGARVLSEREWENGRDQFEGVLEV